MGPLPNGIFMACKWYPKNMGKPPNHPFVRRVWNHYFHHPFWDTSIFGNTHMAADLETFLELTVLEGST